MLGAAARHSRRLRPDAEPEIAGAGSCSHIEEAFGLLFRLDGQPAEYVEFNTEALLRSAFKERIEGLSAGVMGGIIASDEARAQLELPKSPDGFGESVRMQQQMVPMSYGAALQPPDPNANKPAPSSPDVPPEPDAANHSFQDRTRCPCQTRPLICWRRN